MDNHTRKSIAAVYAGKSARERAKLRRAVTADSMLDSMSGYTGLTSDDFGILIEIVNKDKNGGELRMSRLGKSTSVPYKYHGVEREFLRGHVGIEYVGVVARLLGFVPPVEAEHEYLWGFELNLAAATSPAFRKLLASTKGSIASNHLRYDGVWFRVYRMHAAPMVEYRLPHEEFVRVCSVAYFDESIKRSNAACQTSVS